MLTGGVEYVVPIGHFLIAALSSALILFILLRSGWAWRLALDEPNQRSLHQRPVPRVGAWGIIPAALLCGVWHGGGTALAFSVLMLALVSFWDDRLGLPAWVRFGVHIGITAFFLFFILSWSWTIPTLFLLIALVWGINLFNFMDGSDGMAGGMALFGFGAYALAAWQNGNEALTIASVAISGAALGFLLFNFHPARIFMGDSGSIPCGFLAGALGVLGWSTRTWPAWFPVFVFSPFIADATVTLFTRLWRREPFWKAHHTHYYQRLVRSGLGHTKTAGVAYILMVVAAGLALFALKSNIYVQFAAICMMTSLVVGVGWWINRRWRASSI